MGHAQLPRSSGKAATLHHQREHRHIRQQANQFICSHGAQFLFRNQIINTDTAMIIQTLPSVKACHVRPHPLHQRYPFLPDLVLLLVAMVWGSSYGLAKQALLFYPVLGLLALRFGLTFILLLPAQRALADAATRRATLLAALPLGWACWAFSCAKPMAWPTPAPPMRPS
jgi:hypothetical protein